MEKFVKIAAISAVLVFLGLNVFAQEPEKKQNNSGVATTIYASAGVQYLNCNGLNKELNGMNYTDLSDFSYLTGLGFDISIYNHWVIGAEWDRCKNFDVSHNTTTMMKAEFNGSRTMIRFGYNVLNNPKISLVPEIGFGGFLMNLKKQSYVADTVISTLSQTFARNSGNSVAFSNSFFDIGIGFNYIVSDNDNDRNGCRLGLRAGYLIGMSNSWHNNLNDAIIGPKMNPNMFYVKLTVGFISQSR
ncbi:MAG: hypothetical protein HUK15_02780 [Bacteroidales bacterium]|nr:hypothetical protein [Bacteroidales bacterium]